MKEEPITREALWAQQGITADDIDCVRRERDLRLLRASERLRTGCTFVVDVYECAYAYASDRFADLFDYDRRLLRSIGRQGDYLESRIHPDDRDRLEALQIRLGRFIWEQPAAERNDYCNIFGFRMRDARGAYVHAVSRQRVLAPDRKGRAWLIVGNLDIAPDQRARDGVACTVLNLRSGATFTPAERFYNPLTPRETEILRLIRRGLLSKEIAARLGISIHTVGNHRHNLLRKLHVQHTAEALLAGERLGIC